LPFFLQNSQVGVLLLPELGVVVEDDAPEEGELEEDVLEEDDGDGLTPTAE